MEESSFWIKAVQLIAAFGLLVIVHEFGHYIFARMFGIRVEKFYIFFDPWFSLFKYKPKKKPGTEIKPHGAIRNMGLAGFHWADIARSPE